MSLSNQNGPSGLGNYSLSSSQPLSTTTDNISNSLLNMPTNEQINRALAETGERDRLKALFKARLWESGWHEQLKAECMQELRRRGVDKVGPHELVGLLGARAKASVPEQVKEQMLQEIGSFMDKIVKLTQLMHFQRDQFIRVIEEQLRSFGLDKSVNTLESESGVKLEEESVRHLRDYCTRGDLIQVESLIDGLFSDESGRNRARLVLLQHQYKRLLKEGNQMDALLLLQQQITPLCKEREVRELAGMLMSKQVAELDLFESIVSILPAGTVVPNSRLEHLLLQAKLFQFNHCNKHNDTVDLMADEQCNHTSNSNSFKLTQKMKQTDAEVWDLQFSHDGSLLAFTCTDKTVNILSIDGDGNISQKVVLSGFPDTPAVLSFSPDDSLLFIGFDECEGSGWLWSFVEKAYYWEMSFGRGVSAMVWIDNERFVIADRVRPIIVLYNVVRKREEYRWNGIQAASLCYHKTSKSLFVAKMCQNSIFSLHLDSKTITEQPVSIPLSVQILGMTVSGDCLLVSCNDSQLRCFRIRFDSDQITLHLQSVFTGHASTENIFSRPTVLQGARVMLGSEDGRVYVWRMMDGVIETIIGKTSSRMPSCTAAHPALDMIAVGDLQASVSIYTVPLTL